MRVGQTHRGRNAIEITSNTDVLSPSKATNVISVIGQQFQRCRVVRNEVRGEVEHDDRVTRWNAVQLAALAFARKRWQINGHVLTLSPLRSCRYPIPILPLRLRTSLPALASCR